MYLSYIDTTILYLSKMKQTGPVPSVMESIEKSRSELVQLQSESPYLAPNAFSLCCPYPVDAWSLPGARLDASWDRLMCVGVSVGGRRFEQEGSSNSTGIDALENHDRKNSLS